MTEKKKVVESGAEKKKRGKGGRKKKNSLTGIEEAYRVYVEIWYSMFRNL